MISSSTEMWCGYWSRVDGSMDRVRFVLIPRSTTALDAYGVAHLAMAIALPFCLLAGPGSAACACLLHAALCLLLY
jgi:hypothetical protein